MYRKTMAFGRKGVALVAISAVDIALWDLMGKSARQPCYRLMGGRTKPRIPVYASRLYSGPLDELASEAKRYQVEGYQAMKLRFGWGPIDGAPGMARNVELVRTVREAVGDEVDVMADAYMGWSLDYAKRMMRLIEPFNLRWLEEAIIPMTSKVIRSCGVLARHRSPPASTSTPCTAFVSSSSARARLHPVRHQPRRRSHRRAQDTGAGRSPFDSGGAARRADAKLSRGDGQPQFTARGISSRRSTSKSVMSSSGTYSKASPSRRTASSSSTMRCTVSGSRSTKRRSPGSR
jgi:hypothetical protein